MKQHKDPTKNAIRNVIDPFMLDYGFFRSKEKDFYRVRNYLLDNISFGFGRWGSEVIYIYYSVHLLIDPVTSISTYHAGGRLSAKWYPKDHEAACKSAEEILVEIKKFAFEWFNQMDTVNKLEGRWYDSGSAAAFTAIAQGDLDRAKIYLEDALSRKPELIYQSGYPGWRENEYGIDIEKYLKLQVALNAITSNSIEDWKKNIIQEKFSTLGLKFAS